MFPLCVEDMPPVVFRAQTFLAGVRYPATQDELLAHARGREADEEVMLSLYGLPERSYESTIDVASEIARQLRRFPPRGS